MRETGLIFCLICRASIFIITYNGYFQEYSLNVNQLNEDSWSLEREFSLFSTASDEVID